MVGDALGWVDEMMIEGKVKLRNTRPVLLHN
jgi:hypothetical protein